MFLKKTPVKCLTEPQGKLTALEYVGLLTRVSKLIREITGSNPVEVLNFFQASYTQLHKLRSRGLFFV